MAAAEVLLHDRPDGVDDAEKAEPAVAEGVDADLVGGVVDSRGGAAGATAAAGQRDGGKGVIVQGFELPVDRPAPVERS